MGSIEADFRKAIADGFTSRTLTKCSRWACRRRVMGAPFPGYYSYDHHPWCETPSDSQAGMNVAMKAAQTGFSELVINRALYVLAEQRRDCVYYLPTSKNANDFSKVRLGAAIKLSPFLKNLFAKSDSLGLKQTVYGNSLYIRGTRGASNLKSISVSELILDELDEMSHEVVPMTLERLSGQVHKRVYAISTPTVPEYGIHKLYLGTTQEHYFFKCPACSRQTELVWPDSIVICGDHAKDPRVKESHLICKECKASLVHELKHEWLSTTNAFWMPTNDQASPEERGFHISQLYSQTVSPVEMAKSYLEGAGNEEAASEHMRQKVGLPHLGENAKVEDALINQCIQDFTMNDERPTSASLMTMGVDQGKTNWVTILEWFVEEFGYDVNNKAVPKVRWQGRIGEEDFDVLDQLMREWQIRACVLDADPNINEARRFARRFPGFVWLCRYRRGQSDAEMTVKEEDQRAPIVHVDRTHWIGTTLSRFFNNRILLPRDISHQWKDHIKNVARTYLKDEETGQSKLTYLSTGPDHFLHSLVYAEIGLPLAVATAVGATNIVNSPH